MGASGKVASGGALPIFPPRKTLRQFRATKEVGMRSRSGPSEGEDIKEGRRDYEKHDRAKRRKDTK